ncbi:MULTISPECIES: dethiobiotin synthase [unclassified Thioalkalivibrio]|uniref:dethiobiotin synthase n=1 Tax=unclassified Thioalkalivibrio TaxID=2621013 RepID=UPI0003704EE5|nr:MULTISPECIES: dethiobiotin synthase [unclassified Thioalkalivibrio]
MIEIPQGLFVTGSDTGVGKTFVACALLAAWRAEGLAPQPRKPVESGCPERGGTLFPEDGAALTAAAGLPETAVKDVTPWRFPDALAPDQAAARQGVQLTVAELARACDADGAPLLVEGAGGFYSPLCSDGLNADLAQALGLPVLLVAEDRLGILNTCLLTLEALERRGLRLAGIVLNRRRADTDPLLDNASALTRYTPAPILSLPEGISPEGATQKLSTWKSSRRIPPSPGGTSSRV